jgi:hypothetical protein
MDIIDIIFTFFIIVQIQLFFVIGLLFMLLLEERRKSRKPKDQLLVHVKDFILEGYTIGQVREKLLKLGISKERIDKIMTEFMKRD